MDKTLDKTITDYLNNNRDRFIKDLQGLVAFNSVKSEPVDNKPFGKVLADLLDRMMSLCEESGLTTTTYDYYAMEAEYGQGDEVVASLSHLDIVPAGDGWTRDPFAGTVEGNLMYGRGVMDNKGPGLAALYALKALIAARVPLKRKIKLIYGCDEETDMSDMTYYLSRVKAPDYAFSPDADFPLIYAEKHGITGTYAASLPEDSALISLQAGIALNSVPAVATAKLKASACPAATEKVAYSLTDGLLTVTARGTAAHAAEPQEGENALIILMEALLLTLEKDDAARPLLESVVRHMSACDGKGLGVACEDEPSGALTMNLGLASLAHKVLSLRIDIRHPVTLDYRATMDKLARALPLFKLEEIDCHEGVYRPKDGFLVKTLLGVYRDITGDRGEPIAIGGGTYARTLPNAVAFGPEFAGSHSGGAHGSDEHGDIDELLRAARIYAHSFYTLAKDGE